ncbi:MAG: Lrp/AsnC family transcriptional regulator [Alphaproteobacteria bacterium]|nr:Lrp/AsnC family transcriptional regulator [Alphaproteobacteria bacterium]
MDKTDIAIIALLQADGRMSLARIGISVRLSISAVNDRLRGLRARGVLSGTTVIVDPAKVGLGVLAFISVLIDWSAHNEAFSRAVRDMPEVLECHHVTGDWSYLLKVRCWDNGSLEDLISNRIKALPGVTRSETVFAVGTDKETTRLPIG